MIYESFIFGILVYALCFIFGISIAEIKYKIRTSFKALVSKKARAWLLKKNLRVTINFYKTQCLPVII